MLEFFKDGKSVKIYSIGTNGKVGQIIVYGREVDWGPRATPTSAPLSQYQSPSIFIILEIGKGSKGYPSYYCLKDSSDNCFNLDINQAGYYLYDAQEWLTWQSLHQSEKLDRKQKKIELLESHLSLLKDILIKQGTRIITIEQDDALNL